MLLSPLVTIAVAATMILAPAPAPALADGVDATVDVSGGGLSIVAPSTAYLGSVSVGGDLTAPLGTVTVTDLRGVPSASWVASVTSSGFVTGAANSFETVPAEAVDYWSGPATATEGVAAFVPGQPTSASAQALGGPLVAFSANGGDGGGIASWDPTLIVHLPLGVVVGTYQGTITQSVL